GEVTQLMERHKLYLRNIVGSPKNPADHLGPTVDDDSVLLWRVYHLVDAELVLHLDSEAGFLRQLPGRRICDTLKRVDLTTRKNPITPLWILVAFPEQNAIGLVSND